MAARPLQLHNKLDTFSDGSYLSFQINHKKLSDAKVWLSGGKQRPLTSAHLSVTMFSKAVTVHLPLLTDTGKLDKALRKPAGTDVRRFLIILLAFMNNKITTADTRNLTSEAPYASSGPLTGYNYNKLLMDHAFYEGISRSGGRRTVVLGS